jgi:hypothetical protein
MNKYQRAREAVEKILSDYEAHAEYPLDMSDTDIIKEAIRRGKPIPESLREYAIEVFRSARARKPDPK